MWKSSTTSEYKKICNTTLHIAAAAMAMFVFRFVGLDSQKTYKQIAAHYYHLTFIDYDFPSLEPCARLPFYDKNNLFIKFV